MITEPSLKYKFNIAQSIMDDLYNYGTYWFKDSLPDQKFKYKWIKKTSKPTPFNSVEAILKTP